MLVYKCKVGGDAVEYHAFDDHDDQDEFFIDVCTSPVGTKITIEVLEMTDGELDRLQYPED